MPALKYPSILTDLGHVGQHGLPLSAAAPFQMELELCRQWGFQLKTADERVSLIYDQEQLVPYWIQRETPAVAWDWLRVHGFLSIESTNEEALKMAQQGAPAGTLVVAEEQTAGRGRKGHSWFSPARSGLYFSLVVRPGQPVAAWPLLTHVASVALVETLKDFFRQKRVSLEIDIKWPNDVLISAKKCAGILLEAGPGGGESPAAIVGVGLNVHEGSVPPDLKDEAACLDEMAGGFVPRRQILVGFLKKFQNWYKIFEQGKRREVLDQWKSLSSMWDGAAVWISDEAGRRPAVTCGLDENGALLVRTAEGTVETVLAADVRLNRTAGSGNADFH
jgi:BirA family biotin operon repressor/biotin-[acetyl-CoA-carboxylase] ligase